MSARAEVSEGVTADVTAVLFVCLGNICRSPLAEGTFVHLARARRRGPAYRVESAGTGHWHVGEAPDPRSVEVAARHGIRLESLARQVRAEDFHDFDLILAMDSENLRVLEEESRGAGGSARLALLRAFDPEADGDLDVPDPYYGGRDGFQRVFEMVERSCRALLDDLEGKSA